jgi:hypothetical protein
MRYAYYARLSKAAKATYRRSDAIAAITLANARRLRSITEQLERSLASEDRKRVESHAKALCNSVAKDIGAPPVVVRVLAVRPSRDWGELHGLYEPVEGRRRGRITVWMRTARHKRVVAFRTFLRTLLHELCHHLDYEVYAFDDSLHTEGFFKRESSLFKQLVPDRAVTSERRRAR